MNLRKFDKNLDYQTICSWWHDYKWTSIPLDALPETGFIVADFCAGFLYKTDSTICMLEFIISNPNSDKIQKRLALDLLIEQLIKEAKQQNFKTIFTSVENENLLKRYEKHNFIISDKNMTNLMRLL